MAPMPRPEIIDTVGRLTARFGGSTFTTAEAQAAGIAAHRVKSAVRTGHVLRLRRGHYRLTVTSRGTDDSRRSQQPASPVAGLTPLEDSRVRDAITALPHIPAAVGLVRAGAAWEMPTWEIPPSPTPTILVPKESGVRPGVRNGLRFAMRKVSEDHIVTGPGGIPMTDPLLTGIHLAESRHLSLGAQLVVLHGAIRRQAEFDEAVWRWHSDSSGDLSGGTAADERLDGHDLARLVADQGFRRALIDRAVATAAEANLRGVRRVIKALHLADPRVETALESLSWAAFIGAGIPLPTPQALVRGESGKVWRVDFLFEGRVIGECDGAVKYHAGQSLWQEKKRQMDLENAGYVVVRWTWEEIVSHPHVVLARIALALARASRAAS